MTRRRKRWWFVISPPVGQLVDILGHGQGPIEYECGVVEVRASSKSEAIRTGGEIMLKLKMPYVTEQAGEGCPWTGLTAEPLR